MLHRLCFELDHSLMRSYLDIYRRNVLVPGTQAFPLVFSPSGAVVILVLTTCF